jgi:hypothetical protein
VADQLSAEDRTPPLGLFNFARSYWRSAEQLRVSKVGVTHPSAPILFLFYHAIELYLKAFLRSASYDLAQLRGISHRVAKAARAAQKEGLQLTAADFELLAVIDSDDNVIRSRYITTGAYTRPEDEELSDFCQHLDQSVGKRLADDGHPVKQPEKAGWTIDLSEDKDRAGGTLEDGLAEKIETLSSKEREIIAYLLHHRQRVLTCDADGGDAGTLISRGLVRRALQAGQMFAYDEMPVEIPLEVWRFLRANADKFPYEGDEDDPYPWRRDWRI